MLFLRDATAVYVTIGGHSVCSESAVFSVRWLRILKARYLVATCALLLSTSGCSPAFGGVVAVSREGSSMKVAIVPCQNEHITILTFLDREAQADAQGRISGAGRLERSQALTRVTELDPANPGEDWSGRWITDLSELNPGTAYEIGAGGGNWTTTDTTFTSEDLELTAEGSWLHADVETTELLTSASVDEVADKACASSDE